jgi:glycosyltransferase involved in cell wall biosynthesis
VSTTTNILFLSTFDTSFIRQDVELLSRRYHVRRVTGRGVPHIWRILTGVFAADVVYCWFASVYSGIAVAVGRFLGKKTIVVVGGVDVASEPEYSYGIWLSRWRSIFVRYALRHADLVLPVDDALAEEAKRLAEYPGKNIVTVTVGCDSMFWKPLGEKERIVLTVAFALTRARVLVKGLDYLIETARLAPDIQFIVVGTEAALVSELQPSPNIDFLPPVDRDTLLDYYRRAKVYCQPSRREGLPSAVCEAMLCGCVPVGADVGGMRTAIGPVGSLVPSSDSTLLLKGIREALDADGRAGELARARIVNFFPPEKRESELVHLIEALTA